jgi:methionine-gamma-lyase
MLKENTKLIKHGYDCKLSMGSLSTPIFKSSTFCFNSAEEGEKSFKIAYGLEKKNDNEDNCLIYSRLNNPNMEILEDKISILDNSEKSLVFSSGMSAISNTIMSFLDTNDTIFYNEPIYGGTEYLFKTYLKKFKINCIPFESGIDSKKLNGQIKKYNNVKAIFIETPCNPTTILTSINDVKNIISDDILLIVDNTFNGPIFLKPIDLGADLVLYSMTKFIGGHSDLIAGCVSGKRNLIDKIKVTRTILGTTLDPETCWLVQRSLYTLKLRMSKQCENAKKLVNYLKNSEYVKKVYFPSLHENEYQYEIFKREYTDSGSLISFEINGDKKKTFKILNQFKVIKLAVSLGSIDTLIQHPSSMTHSNLSLQDKEKLGINDSLLRCSVGIEDIKDIIDDFNYAFCQSDIIP